MATYGSLTGTACGTGAFVTLFAGVIAGYEIHNPDDTNTLQVQVTLSNGDIWQRLLHPGGSWYPRAGAKGIVKVEAQANGGSITVQHSPSANLDVQQ